MLVAPRLDKLMGKKEGDERGGAREGQQMGLGPRGQSIFRRPCRGSRRFFRRRITLTLLSSTSITILGMI